MLKISFISTNYIILFELEEYLCIIVNKDENWFAALTKVAILKTKLLAGNDQVIDIFTSEDMKKYLTVYFQYLTVNYICVLCYVLCYSAHSPLRLFSGRLHQVLRLLLPKLAIFTTIEYLLPYLCLS